MIHGYTPPTSDSRSWLDANYPEGDVTISHTDTCDAVSRGDECAGGCPITD